MNGSANNIWLVKGSVKYYKVRETIQTMYGYRNGSMKQYAGRQMVQPNSMPFKATK